MKKLVASPGVSDVAAPPAVLASSAALHRQTITVLWTGAFALVMTGLVSGTWTGLLLANLALGAAIPWSAGVMALITWALWSYLGGHFPPRSTEDARRGLLRARPLAAPVAAWAIAAGLCWVIALAGLWIVLHRLAAAHGNPGADFSKFPRLSVAIWLAASAVSGAVSEEAGFRGYFQGALERRGLGAFAVLATALLMAPVHALTQGFVWQTLVFYLLVDAMLGALAYVTGSIRPGVVVHAIGLFIFFAFVWPHDAQRQLIWTRGADAAFWACVAQAALFGALGAAAFVRLVRLARRL